MTAQKIPSSFTSALPPVKISLCLLLLGRQIEHFVDFAYGNIFQSGYSPLVAAIWLLTLSVHICDRKEKKFETREKILLTLITKLISGAFVVQICPHRCNMLTCDVVNRVEWSRVVHVHSEQQHQSDH